MRVLVTGGGGYIGSHACQALARAGFEPVTFDNFSTGWRDAVKFGPCVEGDLLDRASIDRAFEEHTPSAIMHFAAFSLVGEAMEHPSKYWRNNVLGSLNLIDAATRHGCKNFVFSSTCATYGEQDGVVLNESSARAPLNAYGASKCAVEDILQNFGEAHGLQHVIFRYFNVAGSDPQAEIGEFHRPETHLIPLVLDAAAGKRDGITIFGEDYPTADGTCIRDYVHVCDLIDAHFLGLTWLLEGRGSRDFNLGTGTGFSVREVIQTARAVTGCDFPVFEGARRPGDPAKLVSGSQRAQQELGWQPTRSTLPEMIGDAWRWHQVGTYSK